MFACLLFASTGTAQDAKQPLIVDHVPASWLVPPAVVQAKENNQPTGSTLSQTNLVSQPSFIPLAVSKKDRWEEFEREYGIHEQSITWVGRLLQSAKYHLDTLTFVAQQTTRKLEFTYDIAGSTGSATGEPEYSLPMFGTFGKTQLKTVLAIHAPQTGRPYLGIKVAIPFGRGG